MSEAFNITSMFQAAQAAEDTGGGGGDRIGAEELPNGVAVRVKVFYSKAKLTSAGAPAFSIGMEVTEPGHDYAGGRFFTNINLSAKQSDGALSYNKRMFAVLSALGAGDAFMATGPSLDAIAAALKDTEVLLTPQWKTETYNGEERTSLSPFDTVYSPVSAGGGSGF